MSPSLSSSHALSKYLENMLKEKKEDRCGWWILRKYAKQWGMRESVTGKADESEGENEGFDAGGKQEL